jgi:hypothetical protein
MSDLSEVCFCGHLRGLLGWKLTWGWWKLTWEWWVARTGQCELGSGWYLHPGAYAVLRHVAALIIQVIHQHTDPLFKFHCSIVLTKSGTCYKTSFHDLEWHCPPFVCIRTAWPHLVSVCSSSSGWGPHTCISNESPELLLLWHFLFPSTVVISSRTWVSSVVIFDLNVWGGSSCDHDRCNEFVIYTHTHTRVLKSSVSSVLHSVMLFLHFI